MNTDTLAFENEEQRRRAVAWVVALSSAFSVEAPRHTQLPADARRGPLTTDVYQVLYRSTATKRFSSAELLKLLEHARGSNINSQITGILLYREGRFVQIIEGAEEVIRALYDRIRQDARHHQIDTVSEGPIPARHFSEWSMDFGFETPPETGQAPGGPPPPYVLPGLSTTSAHLKRLLEAFIK